ncbi:MAG: hypothetical protein K2L00_01150, partial [Muribaculaceae bacterium]|nr:hypothetical protein [Muribaculaceae bacterium]
MTLQSMKYKAFAMLAAMGAACAGCHSDSPCPPGGEEPGATPDPELLTLCLNVSFDGQESGTRAENDPDRYDDPVSDFETISTLRVIIVRDLKKVSGETGDTLKGIVEANRLVRTNALGRPLHDNLEFKVIANEYKRIYLIANEQYLGAPSESLTAPQKYDSASKYLSSFQGGNPGKEAGPIDLSSLSEWTVSVPGLTPEMKEIKGYDGGLFSP